MILESLRRDLLAPIVIALSSLPGAAVAQDPERGIEFSVLGSTFFGGDAGPIVLSAPLSPEPGYEKTFGSSTGLRVQYYRQIRSVWRWQVGLIHQNWPGKLFEGGELQAGWEFGAPGQFDDLSATGFYGGFTAIGRRGERLRPFAAMDLAIVNLPDLDVTVQGETIPYWRDTTKDYLLIRGGVAYAVSERTSIAAHAGFSILGRPDAVDIFTSATSASAIDIGFGASFSF